MPAKASFRCRFGLAQDLEFGAYYTRVMSSGTMVYQVVGPPVGAVISTLPVGCQTVRVGAVAYSQCGPTYYQRVSSGYQVVVLR